MRDHAPQRSGWERSDEMVTRNVKGTTKWVAVLGLLAAGTLVGWSSRAAAQPASDRPAGYVVLPKIIVHTTGGTPPVAAGGTAVDTIVQMTNTDPANPIQVDCFWVNANNHCGGCPNGPNSCGAICDTTAGCPLGLQCIPGWAVTDFGQVRLTPGQPIGFVASTGLASFPCDTTFPGPGCQGHCSIAIGTSCSRDTDCPSGQICTGQAVGAIPPAPEDPFRGELKCVEVDTNDLPVAENDLKIEATIVQTSIPVATTPATTAASYNGIGFQATDMQPGTQAAGNPLCLGSLPPGSPGGVACNANYEPCPNVLILNHFFDGATPEIGGVVSTDLTLVPCSENLGDPVASANFQVTAQMLIYNEFEQRISSAARVQCYRATSLSDIDTVPGPAGDNFSAFSVGVEGTLTGQTRIRSVRGPDGALGYGLIGVACENYRDAVGGAVVATDAFNLHLDGFNANGDAVYLDVP